MSKTYNYEMSVSKRCYSLRKWKELNALGIAQSEFLATQYFSACSCVSEITSVNVINIFLIRLCKVCCRAERSKACGAVGILYLC